MSQNPDDDTGSLERARERLYKPEALQDRRVPLSVSRNYSLPHEWKKDELQDISSNSSFPRLPTGQKKNMRFAGIFFAAAFIFFLFSLIIAGYLFISGGNSVSTDKVSVDVLGPATIAGGDTVPLSITITNRNSTDIENATIEIVFPSGTRSASNVMSTYPRYTENLGTIKSGGVVTRSVKAIVFGGAGEALTMPISLSYGTSDSNAVFVKKLSYQLAVSSTPLSVSVDMPTEVTAGNQFTFALTVRSNSTVPLSNVVLSGSFPFGFSVISSSPALSNSAFLIGTMRPGTSKTFSITGVLQGQETEQRAFHFTVGTAKTSQDQSLAVTYMTQDATVKITPHFIDTTLELNGDSSSNIVIAPGSYQNATVSYKNTLTTSVKNAVISIAISGSGIDYDSINTTSGFYRSSDRTIVFSRDTDPALASLAPGASGVGAFTFTVPSSQTIPPSSSITFSISVSGARVGDTDTTEQMNTLATKTVKVSTVAELSTYSLYSSGPFKNDGPIPPKSNQATTYTIVWDVQNSGSGLAGGMVTATLPSYVSYLGETSGSGMFSYNPTSRVVSWNVGDLPQGGKAQGAFRVSFTPSTSQKDSSPDLMNKASFSGHDRFAGIQVTATAEPATTIISRDPGYTVLQSLVQ